MGYLNWREASRVCL